MRSIIVTVLATIIFALGATDAVAQSDLRHGVLWYTDAVDPAVVDAAIERYTVGVTGKGGSQDQQRVSIKQEKAEFEWYVYNSATDNYVTSPTGTPEHDFIESLAADRGWDVEEAYMHYWNDTVVVLQGDTIFIPGWGGGSATTADEARVPVYYADMSRRVTNFSTPHGAQLNREALVHMAFDTPFDGSSIYPDGIFLDNSAARLFNYGILVSGGQVREAPGHPVIGTPEYQSWHWTDNYGPFLTALKDTLETSDVWGPDGQRKKLMINVANIWDDEYVSRDAADVIFSEFQYNAVRDFGLGMVDEAFRRTKLAEDAGITCFYPASVMRSIPGRGEFSYAETLRSNLAWYLMTRTPSTLFFQFGTASPSTAGWDSLTWRGCIDRVEERLGQPTGDPYTFASGIDPLGNEYVVKARAYDSGLVLLRNRGEWDEGVEPETAVEVVLPNLFYPMTPDGVSGGGVWTLSLRNGEAGILTDHVVPVSLRSFTARREGRHAVVAWRVSSADDHEGFYLHRQDGDGARFRVTDELFQGGTTYTWTDPTPPAGPASYWLEEVSTDGARTWHGPAILTGRDTTPHLMLAPVRPNPLSTPAQFRFELPEAANVRLALHNSIGQRVAMLVDGPMETGSHTVSWDGRDGAGRRLASGVYLLRLETADAAETRKVVLAR